MNQICPVELLHLAHWATGGHCKLGPLVLLNRTTDSELSSLLPDLALPPLSPSPLPLLDPSLLLASLSRHQTLYCFWTLHHHRHHHSDHCISPYAPGCIQPERSPKVQIWPWCPHECHTPSLQCTALVCEQEISHLCFSLSLVRLSLHGSDGAPGLEHLSEPGLNRDD